MAASYIFSIIFIFVIVFIERDLLSFLSYLLREKLQRYIEELHKL